MGVDVEADDRDEALQEATAVDLDVESQEDDEGDDEYSEKSFLVPDGSPASSGSAYSPVSTKRRRKTLNSRVLAETTDSSE
jgi:hypothetical protein